MIRWMAPIKELLNNQHTYHCHLPLLNYQIEERRDPHRPSAPASLLLFGDRRLSRLSAIGGHLSIFCMLCVVCLWWVSSISWWVMGEDTFASLTWYLLTVPRHTSFNNRLGQAMCFSGQVFIGRQIHTNF